MKIKGLLTALGIFMIFINGMSTVHQSFKIPDQTGIFTVRFSAVPSELNIDASLGFGPVELTEWNQFNCNILFNPEGFIKARNGGAYEADVALNYFKGERYWFQMDVDVAAKTYTVKVTPPGGIEMVLAQDYAFRDDNYTGTLSYFSSKIQSDNPDDFVGVSGFQFGTEDDNPGHDNFNIPVSSNTGDFFVKLEAKPSHDSLNIAFGFSNIKVMDWGDYNILIAFGAGGKLVARNGSVYESVQDVSYKAGENYLFFIEASTVSKTYSAVVITPEGDEYTIAEDYGFRLDNATGESIDYLGLHAVMSEVNGSYLVIDGIETGSLNYDGINPVTNQEIPEQTGIFSHTVVVTPSSDSLNAVVTLNQIEATAWSDLNAIVSFSNSGFVIARNNDTYEADVEYPYKGGESFQITFDVDLTTDLYDVTIRRSPHEAAVLLADDYKLRSTPVETISFLSTKTMWDPAFDGIPGSYLKLSQVGITEKILVANPFINSVPTGDEIEDLTFVEGMDSVMVYLTNVTDGDGGMHAVTVVSESSDEGIATVEVYNFGGNIWLLDVSSVSIGTASITVTISDNGGVENGGEDQHSIHFDVVVESVSGLADQELSSVILYPNPAKGFVNLKGISVVESIAIYNMLGAKVKEVRTNGVDHYSLGIEDCESGIYFIKYYDANMLKIGMDKLMINK